MTVNKKIWLWVDDLREVDSAWQVAADDNVECVCIRTYDQAATFIVEHWNSIERISLDHDLGDKNDLKNGYQLACIIEDLAHTNGNRPKFLSAHSANPPGWAKINAALDTVRANIHALTAS